MRTTALSFLSAFSLVLSTTARALSSGEGQCSSSPKSKVGALYFITNNATANYVLSHNILSDGTVSFAGGYSTDGVGAHGVLPGTDPLSSQGCVVVDGNRLYAVNPGSNSIAMFTIDSRDPTKLTRVGRAVPTNGDFPVSIAVSPTTRNVCVANTGAVNNIQCYSVSPSGLRPLRNAFKPLNQVGAVTPASPFNTVGQILFSPDGNQLLVATRGNMMRTGGTLATIDVRCDGSLGALSATVAPGGFPFSITPIHGVPNAYITADAGEGYAVYDFSKGTGAAAVATGYVTPGHNATCWTQYSKATKSYYITDGGTGVVTEVQVDPVSLNGTLIKQYQLATGALDEAIGTVNGKDYLWVLRGDGLSVDTLYLPAAGQARVIQEYPFQKPAAAQGIATSLLDVQGMAIYLRKH